MGQFRTIRKDARHRLKGNRMRGMLAGGMLMVSGLLTGLLETLLRMFGHVPAFFEPPAPLLSLRNASPHSVLISLMTILLGFLLTALLRQGFCRWTCQLWQEEKPRFSQVFYFFEKIKRSCKAVGLRIAILIRLAGITLLLALPPGTLLWMMYVAFTPSFREENLGRAEPFIWLVIGLWSVLALFLFAVASMRYLPAPFLLAQSPEWKIGKVLRRSKQIMAGEKANALLFFFALSGWFLPVMLAAVATVVSLFVNVTWYGFDLLDAAGVLLVIQWVLLIWQRAYFSACRFGLVEALLLREPEELDSKTKEYLYRTQLEQLLAQEKLAGVQGDLLEETLPPETHTQVWPAADSGI